MSSVFLHLPPGWVAEGVSKIGEVNHDKDIHIYIDQTPKDPVPENCFRIIDILEPFGYLKNRMIDYFNNHKDCYNHIFTYHQDILDNFPNSSISISPTTWVSGYISRKKEFSVSSVFGGKHLSKYLADLEGYNIRWELYTRAEEIKNIPRNFYLSTNYKIPDIDYEGKLLLTDSKEPMFDSQFHVAIENTGVIRNVFSEKLIDCFQTRTIPIYYGPPNIGDFFNTKGMFIVRSVSDIINVCNNLNKNTYDSLKDEIEENYNLSMNYKLLEETLLLNTKKIFNQ